MTNNTNQFFDLMKSCMNPEFFMNSMKNHASLDHSLFTESMKKNAEVVAATNQKLNENIQSLVKKNTDLLQTKASEMFNAVKDATSTGDVNKIAESHREYVKCTIENSMNNAKEILDLTSKASMEIFALVSQSVSAGVNKTCSTPPSNSKPKA